MRVFTQTRVGQVFAEFCGDTANGILIHCNNCGHEQEDQSKTGVKVFCLNCSTELVYAPWCSW